VESLEPENLRVRQPDLVDDLQLHRDPVDAGPVRRPLDRLLDGDKKTAWSQQQTPDQKNVGLDPARVYGFRYLFISIMLLVTKYALSLCDFEEKKCQKHV
jgi:hypothetical protein